MRILVVNGAVSMMEKAPGEQWSDLVAHSRKGNLYASTRYDLIDYDVFIADPDKVSDRGDTEGLKLVGPQIGERVTGGGCLICFASPTSVPWLPIQFQPKAMAGERINLEDGCPEVLKALLQKYQDEMSYKTQFIEQKEWKPLARALNSYPVAGYATHGGGLILMLPEFKSRAKVIRDVLDRVIPVLVPGLKQEAATVIDEGAPEWLGEFPIGKAEEIGHRIAALEEKINRLREDLDGKERKRRDLLSYHGLLWLEGKPLESVVERSLDLLSVHARPKGQIDLACPAPSGGELYIEVEGTTGAIGVRKGRQLLHYIADSDDPSATLGAIIGNPFRKEHPSNRPRARSQVGLFSDELTKMAAKQGWKLLTTLQLFDLVCRHVGGDKSAASDARAALGLK